jgi:hypothetical protein
MDGILFAKGSAIREDYVLDQAHIIDLVPTILYLMGLPIPTGLDGALLKEMIDACHLEENPPQYADDLEFTIPQEFQYSEREAEEIRMRLMNLGYWG